MASIPLTPIEIIQMITTSISNGDEAFSRIFYELIEAYEETDDSTEEKDVLGELVELFLVLQKMFLNIQYLNERSEQLKQPEW